mmetsp:Transcript_7301/g.9939  ORF Transcript_7301/g.9939 Transcript_7301/m.9939 type:complete len:287 (-) Transcript_7301:249-1109(-)
MTLGKNGECEPFETSTVASSSRCHFSNLTHFYRNVAVELNNIGAVLLEKEKYDIAIATFRKAIEAMKLAIHPSENVSRHSFVHCIIQANAHLSGCTYHDMSDDTESHKNSFGMASNGAKTEILQTNEQLSPLMFTQAFYISVSNEDAFGASNCRTINGEYKEEMMIILYNMALSHHIQGTNSGKQCSLDKALKLYDLTNQVIQGLSTSFKDDCRKEKSVVLTRMAVMNNSAVIHSMFARHSMTNALFQKLFEAINDAPRDILVSGDIDYFVVNVMLYGCPCIAAAA